MRATLLVLLGGVLVWVVWISLGKGGDALANERSTGAMLPPETDAGDAEPGAGASAVPTAVSSEKTSVSALPAHTSDGARSTAPMQAANERASASPARAEPATTKDAPNPEAAAKPADPGASAPRTPDLASELELARALVSEPQAFPALVATRSDLSRSRRDLAVALSKAVTGAESEARALLEGLREASDVTTGERIFLERCIDRRTSGTATASATALGSAANPSPLVRAAALVADARDADAARAAGKNKDAAQKYSLILVEYVRAPWKPDPALLRRWSEALNATQRLHRWNKAGDWPSIAIQVEKGDNLIELRKRVVKDHPELLLYTGQIERANQLTGALIKPGQTLRIPTDKAHMLVDLDAHWAFYMLGEEVAAAWEVGVGQEGTETQVGTFRVGKERKEQPMWFRSGKEPVPFGDPENPLGTRWIPWVLPDGQGTGLGFHGTNQPDSIGKDLSQGCIRMRNADVEELYDILPTGAEIVVQP
jgi:hypothetical protein